LDDPELYEALPQWLICRHCGKREPVGNVQQRDTKGWPKCCGETMPITATVYQAVMLEPRGDHGERPDED